MRHSRYKDFWGKVDTRTAAHTAITTIKYGGQTFPVSNIQIVSGQNGSGKSSLLKILASDGTTARPPVFNNLTFDVQNSNIGGQTSSLFQYTSPSQLVEENGRRIKDIASAGQFQDYLESIEPILLSDSDLEQINYVLNTAFSQIQLFELEAAIGYEDNDEQSESPSQNDGNANGVVNSDHSNDLSDGIAVFIKANVSGETEAHSCLSQGEIYIILLTYFLNKSRGKSILIDEPETYLSPLSQYRLADVLAYYSVEKKCQFILATHSISFIEKVNPSATLMLDGAHNNDLNLMTGRRFSSYLRRLGYKVPKENIALFEDENAKAFFSNIAREFDADWLSSFEMISLNGESDIIAIIQRVKNYKITAIFDADQKGRTRPEDYPQHYVTFLPGTQAPEKELINALRTNVTEYAQKLRVCEGELNAWLRMNQGIDHHDFFGELAKISQIKKERLFEDAFAVWASKNGEAIQLFLSGFA